MWGFLPTRFIDYFLGIKAFRMNANNPAGIRPVVKSSFKLIPKSGIFFTKSGNSDIPIPKDRDRAKINKFYRARYIDRLSDYKTKTGCNRRKRK